MFAKLLTQIIKLKAHFPNYSIKSIRVDNVSEFISKIFDDYCMSMKIDIEHPIPYVNNSR